MIKRQKIRGYTKDFLHVKNGFVKGTSSTVDDGIQPELQCSSPGTRPLPETIPSVKRWWCWCWWTWSLYQPFLPGIFEDHFNHCGLFFFDDPPFLEDGRSLRKRCSKKIKKDSQTVSFHNDGRNNLNDQDKHLAHNISPARAYSETRSLSFSICWLISLAKLPC